jgi:excisionase family DNA binding protein
VADSSQLLDSAEVADRLHVSPRTVRRWAQRGVIDSFRVGEKLLRFPEESVEAMKRKEAAA